MSGLYLHIPFCRRACSYCDFYFSTTQKLLPEFSNALIREIRQSPEAWLAEPVKTVYFGGGTPSMLSPAQLGAILSEIRNTFTVSKDAEVTLEANPEDISVERCAEWLAMGINRLSLGIQTFDAETLRWMNRPHSPEDARNAVRTVATAGFSSFSCDLIYALPNQTSESLLSDLAQMMVFQPPHVSAYSLTVEEGTRLGAWVKAGKIVPPEDERAADFMDQTGEFLQKNGYSRYEVSNFCLPGHHSRHNSAYWEHENYFGFGPGAHSFFRTGEGALRWSNPPKLNRYVKLESFDAFREEEPVSAAGLLEEKIYLRLRTIRGFDLQELALFFGGTTPSGLSRKVQQLVSEGFLNQFGTRIAVSEKGFPVSDRISLDILSEIRL